MNEEQRSKLNELVIGLSASQIRFKELEGLLYSQISILRSNMIKENKLKAFAYTTNSFDYQGWEEFFSLLDEVYLALTELLNN